MDILMPSHMQYKQTETSTDPLVFNVAWVPFVPVRDSTDVWLYDTDTCLSCSLSLHKAANDTMLRILR